MEAASGVQRPDGPLIIGVKQQTSACHRAQELRGALAEEKDQSFHFQTREDALTGQVLKVRIFVLTTVNPSRICTYIDTPSMIRISESIGYIAVQWRVGDALPRILFLEVGTYGQAIYLFAGPHINVRSLLVRTPDGCNPRIGQVGCRRLPAPPIVSATKHAAPQGSCI
jgi:hypothetical protein